MTSGAGVHGALRLVVDALADARTVATLAQGQIDVLDERAHDAEQAVAALVASLADERRARLALVAEVAALRSELRALEAHACGPEGLTARLDDIEDRVEALEGATDPGAIEAGGAIRDALDLYDGPDVRPVDAWSAWVGRDGAAAAGGAVAWLVASVVELGERIEAATVDRPLPWGAR